MPAFHPQPVSKWSSVQAARWIKSCVRDNRYEITEHALVEALKDNVSVEEVLECIRTGKVAHWEPDENPIDRKPDMRLRFVLSKKLKTITVVAAVSDFYPDTVVITTWAKPTRK